MQTAYDSNAYKQHAQRIAGRFEVRRAQFLRKFKMRAAVAAVLLLTFPWWFGAISTWDAAHSNVISSIGQTIIEGFAALIIISLIIIYALLPIFRYRNYTIQFGASIPWVAGFASQNVSLKSEIFSELMSFFGDFKLHNERKLSLNHFQFAPHMPEFDEFVSEDFIEGQMHGVGVEITEARLQVRTHKELVDVFSGLMVIADLNDINRALRGKFRANTVVIADRSREMDYVASKYRDYRRLILPDASYEHRFETFSSDEKEATALVSSDLLRHVLKLSDVLKNTKNQTLSADEKLSHLVNRIMHGAADAIGFVVTRSLLWLKTGSFNLRSSRHHAALPLLVRDDAKALSACVHVAFYDEKMVITIPNAHNLFEPDSLFKPPLSEQDIELTYQFMTSIGGIVQAMLAGLKKTQAS